MHFNLKTFCKKCISIFVTFSFAIFLKTYFYTTGKIKLVLQCKIKLENDYLLLKKKNIFLNVNFLHKNSNFLVKSVERHQQEKKSPREH